MGSFAEYMALKPLLRTLWSERKTTNSSLDVPLTSGGILEPHRLSEKLVNFHPGHYGWSSGHIYIVTVIRHQNRRIL